MLNKLLKRCMPWMDKGRWYHVEFKVDGNGQITYLKYDNIFDRHDVQTQDNYATISLHIDSERQRMNVIDYKYVSIHENLDKFVFMPGDLGFYPYIVYDEEATTPLDIYLNFSGSPYEHVKCWIYITEV